MLNPEDVKLAIKEGGMSAACAWCLKYWRARKDGQHGKSWTCQATQACGGPMQGMAFPEYEGPMQGNLSRICYICGGEPDAAVEIHGKGVLGVCGRENARYGRKCIDLLRDQMLNRSTVRTFEEKKINLMDWLVGNDTDQSVTGG